MTYAREHDMANEHPIKIAGFKKADRAVKAARKSMQAKAMKLRQKAEKLLTEASDLDYIATKYYEDGPLKELREKLEDAAYWEARKAVGVLPRNENGDYIDPAPFWRATLVKTGEHLGDFQGDEPYDVFRIICPHDPNDPAYREGMNWGDFEVEKVR